MTSVMLYTTSGMSIREIKSIDLQNRTVIVHSFGSPWQRNQDIELKLSQIHIRGTIEEIREFFKTYLQETL